MVLGERPAVTLFERPPCSGLGLGARSIQAAGGVVDFRALTN